MSETKLISTPCSADYCPFEGQTYGANLQQAIEYHCRGEIIPDALAKRCPHHAKMLNADLKANDQSLLAKFVAVLNAYEGGDVLVSCQGQGMDGYSALANFKSLAEQARDLLANGLL